MTKAHHRFFSFLRSTEKFSSNRMKNKYRKAIKIKHELEIILLDLNKIIFDSHEFINTGATHSNKYHS